MEEFVWTEPDILELLQNEVILASVYIDDKELLPENEQTSIDMGGGQKKKIKTKIHVMDKPFLDKVKVDLEQ